jgi:flagellar biosynthesis anti-sigma factor FlgM
MTSIGPPSQNPETAAPAGQAKAAAAASVQANQAAAKHASATADAVTVSKDAVTAAQLLTAARNSSGVDQAAVQSLKSQIQAGTYNVSPEKLATSISTALNGISC